MPRTDAMLQKPLDRLMARTAASRASRQEQDGQAPFSQEALSDEFLGLGDTDSDLLFSGLDWLSVSLF
jgi:hypothetical protein